MSSRSCSNARIAAIAIFCSNRIQMYTLTRSRKTTRAIRAFSVTSSPQDELTVLSVTASASTFSSLAIASLTLAVSSTFSVAAFMTYLVCAPLPASWIDCTSAPADSAASCTCSVLVPAGLSTVNEVPPENSIPQLKPRNTISAMQMTVRTAETMYHRLREPMKSIFVSPW